MAGKIQRIWHALAACFDASSQPLTKGQIAAWIGLHYKEDDFNSATLQAQIYRSCVNVPSAQHYNTPKILFFDRRTRTYSRIKSETLSADESEVFNQDIQDLAEDIDENLLEPEDQSDLLVGLEAQLRDYLAKNMGKLEKGLTFWDESPPSVEYVIDGRRIDILAKDIEGIPVVIELKRKKAYDQVIGQALLYQALVSKKFKLPRVRAFIVANEISVELQLATSRQPDVKLFEYELTMKLNPITSTTLEEEA